MDKILTIILASSTPFFALLIVLLLYPEKIEKWSALIWKFLDNFRKLFKNAHKKYVTHDLQGRINEFSKHLSKMVPNFEKYKVKIEWVDEDLTKKNFFDEDKVILRLKRDDNEESNFIHGSYHYVSTCLLYRVKKYISPSQRESLDLYVTSDLIKYEKPSVIDAYLDLYLHPKLKDKKRVKYYDSYYTIDKSGYFYPILIQEMDFLGRKVFGKKQDQHVIKEIDELIQFLENVSARTIGDETDLKFQKDYSKLAIMIIGKPSKLVDVEVYINFIKNQISDVSIDSIYAIGLYENKDKMDYICEEVENIFQKWHCGESTGIIQYNDGVKKKIKQYFIALRKKEVEFYSGTPN